MSNVFNPMILQTKEELSVALKQGKLKTAKYNLLSESEKQFVELVCFGGYSGEEAVRAINPGVKNPYSIANTVMSNPDVAATIQELTVAKDTRFKSEISSARDMALAKLQYIMATTKDESLAASCAKVILDKAETAIRDVTKGNKEDESVGAVKFNIQVENVYNGNASPKNSEPVIIELTDEEINPAVQEAKEHLEELNSQIVESEGKVGIHRGVNESGMPYTLHYEGVDNYNDTPDWEDDNKKEGA